ncbi:MAG: lysylphosphatidylglycerol synthase transmembrane domain-containing protein [Actinomycetota bacterium]
MPATAARRRAIRVALTLLVTGACLAYILIRVDLRRTVTALAHSDLRWFALAFATLLATLPPITWRWQRLLRAGGVEASFGSLLRANVIAYAAGQVLPTAVGGDATRIYETTRRNGGAGGAVAGSVVLERALGACATLILAALGFVLAIGRYPVGAYVWLECVFAFGTLVVGILFFSRTLRAPLARVVPLLRVVRLDRVLRSVYVAIHAYRAHKRLLVEMLALTLVVQAVRVLTIWMAAEAAGLRLSPIPFFVMGPLLFLVMLVPFTVNGFAVRETFFVDFLTRLGAHPEAAFVTGVLYFLLAVGLGLPGLFVLTWTAIRSALGARPSAAGRSSSG